MWSSIKFFNNLLWQCSSVDSLQRRVTVSFFALSANFLILSDWFSISFRYLFSYIAQSIRLLFQSSNSSLLGASSLFHSTIFAFSLLKGRHQSLITKILIPSSSPGLSYTDLVFNILFLPLNWSRRTDKISIPCQVSSGILDKIPFLLVSARPLHQF